MVFVSHWRAPTDILLLKFVQYLGEADLYVHIYGVWSKVYIYIYVVAIVNCIKKRSFVRYFIHSLVPSFILLFIYLFIYVSTKSFFCHSFHFNSFFLSLFIHHTGFWRLKISMILVYPLYMDVCINQAIMWQCVDEWDICWDDLPRNNQTKNQRDNLILLYGGYIPKDPITF